MEIIKHSQRGWNGLEAFSKSLYKNTYFKKGDTYEKWLKRISSKYANDEQQANRIETYIHNYWFHPSTPISSDRGLPISCFVSSIPDTSEGIFDGYLEGMFLGAGGGGRGVYWGNIRGLNSPIGSYSKNKTFKELIDDEDVVKSSGVIPFLGVSDRATYAITQANVRRSTEAAYLPIDHPDILDFIDIRLESGDRNRRTPNLHHGIAITDKFMEAVKNLQSWDLIDPHTGLVTDTVDAFDLWMDILLIRKTEAGEPYLVFIDIINKDNPEEYIKEGLKVESSNICTEIVGATNDELTTVCCLASINVEYFDEFEDNIDIMVADISDYLTNVLLYTVSEIDKYPEIKQRAYRKVKKFILDTMEIGIGIMGFHSLLQKKLIPFESPMAIGLSNNIMTKIKNASDKRQQSISKDERCLLSKKYGTHKRNLHSIAIAPTMSISTLANVCSSGVEPWIANSFIKKVPNGTFTIRNRYLKQLLSNKQSELGKDDSWLSDVWKQIVADGGSVQGLDFLSQYEKDVFKTAFEIDQRQIIKLAADRQKIMLNEQAQSINIFIPSEISYEELYAIHMMAYDNGLKSLYYLRSQPDSTASIGNTERKEITLEDDACVACT